MIVGAGMVLISSFAIELFNWFPLALYNVVCLCHSHFRGIKDKAASIYLCTIDVGLMFMTLYEKDNPFYVDQYISGPDRKLIYHNQIIVHPNKQLSLFWYTVWRPYSLLTQEVSMWIKLFILDLFIDTTHKQWMRPSAAKDTYLKVKFDRGFFPL